MTIGALIHGDGSEALALLAMRLADALNTDLVLAWVGSGKEEGGAVDFHEPTEKKKTTTFPNWLVSIPGTDFGSISSCHLWRLPGMWSGDDLQTLVNETGTDLLMVDFSVLDKRGDEVGEDLLDRHTACSLMVFKGTLAACPETILIPVAGGVHAKRALKFFTPLVRKLPNINGEPPFTIMQAVDDMGADALEVGQSHLRDYLGDHLPYWRRKVVCSQDPLATIAREAKDKDLVLIGASDDLPILRMLKGKFAKRLAVEAQVPVAVFRRASPIHHRLRHRLDTFLTLRFPQLDRDQRIDLVDKLDSGSRAGFDFLSMIILSTLIAGLGLIQNSTAVVVGAMLVAPLMTPIMGVGLGLVQGNHHLVRRSAVSIALGFLGAFLVGIILGTSVPMNGLTNELLARGNPNILDLVVALVSGVAGAYAMARPSMSAALPGVAIAAALVPPIATSGIAMASGIMEVSLGALLLFGTNVVAIILGTAATLYAVGIRPRKDQTKGKTWVMRIVLSLMATTTVLAIPLIAVMIATFSSASEAKTLRQRINTLLEPQNSRVGHISFDNAGVPTLEIIGPEALNQETLKKLHEASEEPRIRIRHTHEQTLSVSE